MPVMLPFRTNDRPTVGVELELMLVDSGSLDLATSAVRIERATHERGLDRHVKLEITQSMIEINSSVHDGCAGLESELASLGSELAAAALPHATRICGGGTHPFHRWQERRISPAGRFHEVANLYGYLAKQFTVFGQHVHVGCADGDDAIRVIRVLSRFVPHFIALAAASPFHRGVDTAFDSCRLNMVAAFPLSGRMTGIESWADFERFYERLLRMGVVGSLKDFYWDIRPKPEFGTVELRVPDTPLDVALATDLAAYMQLLVSASRTLDVPEWLDDYVYRHNRFQATRFGYEGRVVVSPAGERTSIQDDIRWTIDRLRDHATDAACAAAVERVYARAAAAENGASWLRHVYAQSGDLRAVVAAACDRWLANCTPAADDAVA
jgi:carboxylate-amine ligase